MVSVDVKPHVPFPTWVSVDMSFHMFSVSVLLLTDFLCWLFWHLTQLRSVVCVPAGPVWPYSVCILPPTTRGQITQVSYWVEPLHMRLTLFNTLSLLFFLLLVFSDTAPVYMSDLLHVYFPSRQLRSSSDSRTLRIPHIKTNTSGHRSFSHAAPSVWNSLPHEIRHIQSATAFKTALRLICSNPTSAN